MERTFRGAVRGTDAVGMANDALGEFVGHNLRRVIPPQIELGSKAAFWQDDQGDRPRDVLPLVRRG